MLSDFFFLNHLFCGLGIHQAWFTCLNPEDLITRYGEFAHGNYHHPRRVVLDIHRQPDLSTMHVE